LRGGGKGEQYLLMLRLFFLEPKSPWRKRIGGALAEAGLGGGWRS